MFVFGKWLAREWGFVLAGFPAGGFIVRGKCGLSRNTEGEMLRSQDGVVNKYVFIKCVINTNVVSSMHYPNFLNSKDTQNPPR